MRRKAEFKNGEHYHVYNRGVDKRRIFLDDRDYRRFHRSLSLFNDVAASFDTGISQLRKQDIDLLIQKAREHRREPLVDILSFILMPNHFHLLIRQCAEDGISRFLHRVAKGYSRYFNLRHGRTGTLFEGTFKAVHIDHESYLAHLPRYIHLNALDVTMPQWRKGKVKNWTDARRALDQYQWSSHHFYSGKIERDDVVAHGALKETFGTSEQYFQQLRSWSLRDSMKVREYVFD